MHVYIYTYKILILFSRVDCTVIWSYCLYKSVQGFSAHVHDYIVHFTLSNIHIGIIELDIQSYFDNN